MCIRIASEILPCSQYLIHTATLIYRFVYYDVTLNFNLLKWLLDGLLHSDDQKLSLS
jgi:hypothetical protein